MNHRIREPKPAMWAVGWKAVALFLGLLAVISVVPYAGHHATVKAALDREKSRHALLVGQVAQRMRHQMEYRAETIKRLAESVMALPLDSPHVASEVRTTWAMLSGAGRTDGMALVSESGDMLLRLGVAEHPESETTYRAAAQAALRAPEMLISQAAGGEGPDLRVALAAPIVRPNGEMAGAVVATVNVGRMIDKLFEGLYEQKAVTFTVLTKDGRLLLHSGLTDMEGSAKRSAARCGSCHADPATLLPVLAGGSLNPREMAFSGSQRVLAYAPVSIGSLSWTVSASTSVEEATRPLARQAMVFLSFTVGVVVLLLLLGALLRRSQIRAIRLEQDLAAQRELLALTEEKERLGRELETSRRLTAIGEMVARVAHEVKNPLQYIGTAADLLSARAQDPKVAGLVDDMRTGVRTLDAIVKELLEFSRPMRLEKVPLHLNDIARDVAERAARDKGSVTLSLAERLPPILADGHKLRQVVENLARNAQEALAQRGGAGGFVEIGTADVTQGPCAGGAVLWVRDNGCGIPEENLDRIWEPFYTTKTRGSGLGLSVVRRIVEAHGGVVRVRTRSGEGTTFEVLLPPGG